MLPLLPEGATRINAQVGVFNEGGHWTYLLGMHPIYRHEVENWRGFRITVAQLVDSGACRAVEIIKAFGISKSSMDRTIRKYRQGGLEAFFTRQARVCEGPVLTAEVLARAQELLDEGLSKAAVAEQLGVRLDTLRRAVWDGRLRGTKAVRTEAGEAIAGSDKSQRTVEDARAGEGMGTGCTRAGERVLAALGKLPQLASIPLHGSKEF
jgi:transposase